MPVKLQWVDENFSEDGFRVYRDTVTIDPNSPPAALATLGANVTEYIDTTAAAGTTYYYRISTYLGSVELFSDEITVNTAVTNGDIIGGPLDNFFWKMDQISGSTITDELGKNNGTIVGGATQTTFGTTGYALQLNGTSQYVAIQNMLRLSTENITELSAGLWFKTNQPAQDQVLISFDRSEFYRLEIGGDAGGNVGGYTQRRIGVGYRTDLGQTDFGGTHNLEDLDDNWDGWHLAVFTFDNGLMTLYIDGWIDNQLDEGSTIGSNSANRAGFVGVGSESATPGGGTTGPDYYMNGLITKVFDCNRVLSQEEIVAMYNQGPEL